MPGPSGKDPEDSVLLAEARARASADQHLGLVTRRQVLEDQRLASSGAGPPGSHNCVKRGVFEGLREGVGLADAVRTE